MRPSVSRSLGSWRAWVALQPRAPAPGAAGQDVRVVEQTVEQRRDGGGVAQELAPVFDGTIRRDQRGGFFIAAHHDLQEVLGRSLGQPPHPEVINEEQRDGGDLRDVVLAGAGELRLGELLEEDVGLAVQDAMALLVTAKPIAWAKWLLPV